MLIKVIARHGSKFVCLVRERYKPRLRYLSERELAALTEGGRISTDSFAPAVRDPGAVAQSPLDARDLPAQQVSDRADSGLP
jgi:hypothetical protein